MSEGSLKIPKQAVTVRVLMRGAREWSGQIFLNFYSPFHEGAQGLSEFLNEPLPFMPVRFSSGEVRIVGKGEIIAIAASLDALAHHGASTEFAILQRAEIHLVDSVVLEGDVNLSDASVPGPRLIDVLNNTSSFISLKSGPEFYAVNKSAVRWAVPLEFCGAEGSGESESQEPAHV
ncbi:MAG: hypothetical protein ACKVU1_11045 [bacterium]